ncbi:MAG: Uma2 family endonuclease [Bacteroidia bacterium]
MAEHKLNRSYSVEEYFDLESTDPKTKYEFVDGIIYAMAGGTIRHGLLISNVLYWVKDGLRKAGKPCKTFSGDVKVSVEHANSYLYPDVFVVCGKIDDEKNPNHAIKNPKLIIEVLSESTQNYDQTHKFRLYRSNPSFEEYIMIDQEQAIVESFVRISNDHWQIRTYIGLDKEIELSSIGISLRMQDIYEDVMS